MTDRDPDLQRAIDTQTARWARYLAGRLLPGLDPTQVARTIVEGQHADGWWPHPKAPDIPGRRPGTGAPPTPEWRQAKAALRKTRPEETR